jgi:hypothetical protein
MERDLAFYQKLEVSFFNTILSYKLLPLENSIREIGKEIKWCAYLKNYPTLIFGT